MQQPPGATWPARNDGDPPRLHAAGASLGFHPALWKATTGWEPRPGVKAQNRRTFAGHELIEKQSSMAICQSPVQDQRAGIQRQRRWQGRGMVDP